MTKNSEPFTLPPSPKGLCFDKNYFLGDNFSVDGFLHDHRNAGSLESMRDDLGVYLKVLRSAMIELINKDYADFVNLSANLIGLDKEINNIQTPLGQLREEVLHVQECLHDAMKELSGRLEQRKHLREKKRSLQYLSEAQVSLNKLNSILFNNDTLDEDLSIEIIERASLEYNHLKFTNEKCKQYITKEQSDLTERIGNRIQSILGDMFLTNLNVRNIDKLQQCLQIFSTLNKGSVVETLYRKKIIAPSMHDVICELALQKNPNGLKGVYANILSFIDIRFKDLLTVTSQSNKKSVHGYNFLLNSFWPEVEYRIEVHMASIFAPGNPELFYSRYNDSLEFLNRFLQHFECRKSVKEFYAHSQYKSFQHRWNLPVYFQIRFQEIAGSLENVLSESISDCSIINEMKPDQIFNLKATTSCWSSLAMCWADGIFILALAHRFWKLTLQILSRYSTWVSSTIKQLSSTAMEKKAGANENTNEKTKTLDKLKFQIFLHVDIMKLIESLPTLLEIVNSRLQSTNQKENLEKSLLDAKTMLMSHLPQIKKNVVTSIGDESNLKLKQLNDIPRLFRKTNRDIPSKPSGYVAALIKPPTEFQKNYVSYVGADNIKEWMMDIFCVITTRYRTGVDDVLTSVQRTEESLRRLKHVRDRSSQTNLEKMGVSDDDKIRLQLKVDVQVYVQYLTDMNLDLDKITNLKDLQELVEKATTKSNPAIPVSASTLGA